MSEQQRTAIKPTPTGDPLSDRHNLIDVLAEAIHADERWDHPLSWADAWNAARVAVDSGWRPQYGRSDHG